MSDDKSKQGYQDDSKIDGDDPNELAYASRAWNVQRDDIRKAIKVVGNSRKKIRDYLRENGKMQEEE
jgi:hypothetical protein